MLTLIKFPFGMWFSMLKSRNLWIESTFFFVYCVPCINFFANFGFAICRWYEMWKVTVIWFLFGVSSYVIFEAIYPSMESTSGNAHTDMVSLWYEFLRDSFATPFPQYSYWNVFFFFFFFGYGFLCVENRISINLYGMIKVAAMRIFYAAGLRK